MSCGVITPWNFPIAIPSWKILPALVCGNTVVFKPATDTPFLGERFVELLVEAGVPAGVVNVVHGGGAEVGNAIVEHPDVPVISLTGSRETGVAVTKTGADRLKHIHLELGGKNAIIVLDDADLDLAVEGILWAAFGTTGPALHGGEPRDRRESVYDELVSRLVRSARAAAPRRWARDDDTEVGPVINKSAREKIHSYIEIGKQEGAKLVVGGSAASEERARDGLLLPADDLRRGEAADAHRPGGDLRPGALGPHGRFAGRGDPRAERHAVRPVLVDLHAGREPRHARHARHRGRDHVRERPDHRRRSAASVRRREGDGERPPRGGQTVIDVFTEWKSVYIDYSGKLQKAQIDR